MSKLRALRDLTDAELARAQSVVRGLLVRESGLRENLANLSAQEKHATSVNEGPKLSAGAHLRWQKWVEVRRATVNTELAEVMGRKLQAQAVLRRAFGKDQALSALIKRHQRDEKTANRRRAL